MRITDLFIRRPVLAVVVNLVILIAGIQAVRTLSVPQYPRSDIAVVQVTTAYVGANADLVRGVEHFRTPLSRVIEIMEYLRGRLSGLAIPAFVVDAPHGGGKIPLLPTYVVSTSPTHTVLRNFEGMLVAYPEPCDPHPAHPVSAGVKPGVGPGVVRYRAARDEGVGGDRNIHGVRANGGGG